MHTTVVQHFLKLHVSSSSIASSRAGSGLANNGCARAISESKFTHIESRVGWCNTSRESYDVCGA